MCRIENVAILIVVDLEISAVTRLGDTIRARVGNKQNKARPSSPTAPVRKPTLVRLALVRSKMRGPEPAVRLAPDGNQNELPAPRKPSPRTGADHSGSRKIYTLLRSAGFGVVVGSYSRWKTWREVLLKG